MSPVKLHAATDCTGLAVQRALMGAILSTMCCPARSSASEHRLPSVPSVQGDDQQGIDIVARQRGAEGDEVWVYQCKRYKEYTPAKLKEALANMAYPADYCVLVLGIPATAALRQVADDKPNVFLWDAKDIACKLKNYPTIVEDFFGPAWRQAFCG